MNAKEIAEAYYQAMGKKDAQTVESYLHPEVRFSGPLAQMTGKDAVYEAAKNFLSFLKTFTIRASFGYDAQAVIMYELDSLSLPGTFRGASFVTIKDDLIISIELFYDARPFEQKSAEIFKK